MSETRTKISDIDVVKKRSIFTLQIITMFGKKKQTTSIDKDQLELIENAQKRIRQKKRLYVHFVVFLIGAVFLIIANTILGIGKDFTIAGVNWFVYAIFAWLFFFAYHFISVFVTHKFMGKDWEKHMLSASHKKTQRCCYCVLKCAAYLPG